MKIRSYTFFLYLAVVITVGFLFLPVLLDPLATGDIPPRVLSSDSELVKYLASIQGQDNVIIGLSQGYSDDPALSFVPLTARTKKDIEIFEQVGLDVGWIDSDSLSYSRDFWSIAKYLGYSEENYYIEDVSRRENSFSMPVKSEALALINAAKEGDYDIVFKEYTDGWNNGNFSDYVKATLVLKDDMVTSIDGIALNLADYNRYTEQFIKRAMADYSEIRFIRLKPVSLNDNLESLKSIVAVANETGRLIMIPVIPILSGTIYHPLLDDVIKITWFVFLPFFFFPLAYMLPLHYWERRKIRKKPLKSSRLPKVSMIFPAYNEEKLIGKTIERALRQDYAGEMEIIIIDDGSTDRTREIALSYQEKYPDKIIVHTQDVNKKGKPAGLNTGFQLASGEISVFSDSDSHLNSDLVRLMVPHFDDPKIGMVAGMIVVDNEVNLLTRLQQLEYLYNQEIIRFCQHTHKGVLICPGAATAVRTQIGRDIPSTERTVTEDSDFTFEVAEAGWLVTQEPEAVSWTEAPDNIPAFIDQRKRWLYGVLQTIVIHKWALFFKGSKVPNLWVWWAWIGYLTCPITTLAVLLMPWLYAWLGPAYVVFLAYYSAVVFALYGFVTWYGVKQYRHQNKMNLLLLLPLYIIYQYLLNTLLFYLVIAFILRIGVRVRYGGRIIHAV